MKCIVVSTDDVRVDVWTEKSESRIRYLLKLVTIDKSTHVSESGPCTGSVAQLQCQALLSHR